MRHDRVNIYQARSMQLITHPIADTGSTVLPRFQGVYKRDEDTRTGVSDGVTESDRTTIKYMSITVLSQAIVATYPRGLIFAGSIPSFFSAIRTTTENASLTSKCAMSSSLRPARSTAVGSAKVGASGKSTGSTPASACAVIDSQSRSQCARLRLTILTDNFRERLDAELASLLCRHEDEC